MTTLLYIAACAALGFAALRLQTRKQAARQTAVCVVRANGKTVVQQEGRFLE